jgi:hypothetical protein
MQNLASSSQPQELAVFAPKVETVWKVLSDRYGNRISAAELDHLFARFVFGLTSPSYGEEPPSIHFQICRELVWLKLPPERAYAALHTVPEPTQPWIPDAYEAAERQGAKIGRVLTEQIRNREDRSDAQLDAGASSGIGQDHEELTNDKIH